MPAIPNLPGVSVTIKDGALAAAAGLGTDRCAVLGACPAGTPNTVYEFTDPQTLRDTLGTSVSGGVAVELAALILAVSGKPVVVVPPTPTNGSVGSVTLTGTGVDPGAGFTGNPLDGYKIRIKITLGGARGTARFRVAFDGDNPDGPTYGAEIVTAATVTTYATATGLTITFTTGSDYVLGDVYAADCTAPSISNANYQTALTALGADGRACRMVVLANEASSVSNGAALASILDTYLIAQETAHNPSWGLMNAPSDSDANLSAGFSSFSTKMVGVAAGFETLTSVLTGRVTSRPIAWATAARAMAMTISQDLGEVRAGALAAVVSLTRDERKTPGLDAAGFLTHRTHIGLNGAYVTNPRIMAPAGSDFQLVQYRQVMNVAHRVAYGALLLYLNAELLVNADGTIDETEAQGIDAAVSNALASALVQPGYASFVEAVTDRTNNLLTTATLKVKVRVRPKGYAKAISAEIGFQNPNLVVTE